MTIKFTASGDPRGVPGSDNDADAFLQKSMIRVMDWVAGRVMLSPEDREADLSDDLYDAERDMDCVAPEDCEAVAEELRTRAGAEK